nr:MAG TPA: minor tail protein [Caudoviricetes sp.]
MTVATEIDNLQIKIGAEAQKANNEIDKLINKLGVLSKSLGGVDTKGLQKLASGVNILSVAMQSFQGVKLSDFTRIAKGIQKFEAVDGSKLSQLSSTLTPLASGIATLSGLNFDNKGLVNFINSITRLSNSNVSGLNSVNFAQLGANINQLTSALNGSKTVASNTIQVVNAVSRLASAGANAQATSTALPLLGANLKRLINSLSKASVVSENTIQFASALGLLASAGSRTAQTAANLDALAEALKRFMQTMSTAPTVNANIIQMTQAIGQLASNGNRVGGVTRGLTSSLNSWGNSAQKASKHSFNLASAIGKVYATYWMLFRALGVFRKAIDISGALTEVQNVVSHSFGPSMDKVEEQAKNAIYTLGMSELSFKKYASTYQSMGIAMGITAKQVGDANNFLAKSTDGYVQASDDMADVSLNLTKLAGDIASFYDKSQADVAEDLQSVFTGTIMPMRKYGVSLDMASLKAFALANGLNADVSSMTQAEKTMLRYQYVMAQTTAAQGDFARTADTWNNQVRLLGENFKRLGAIWGNAGINMLKPLLQALNKGLDAVINFSENIVNALGAIFGWKLEIQRGSLADDFENAATGADDLASGTGKAADNAKKLKQQLQGFDELNVLNTPNDGSGGSGGSGGGGASSGGSSGGMKFNVTETDGLYKSAISNLRGLGEYIGINLTKELESIDWDSAYKGAENFGKGLADFLTGLISPQLFYATGKTIANSLNTAITASLSFTDNFDFDDLGLSIASEINGFFQNFDFKKFAKAINGWVDGIEDTVFTALKNISWSDVLKGGIDFLTELDLDTVVIAIGAFKWMHGGKEIATGVLKNLLAKEISTGIGDKTIPLSKAISISITTAVIGFKVGNWLYENTPFSKFADVVAKWLVDKEGNVNIAKAISLTIASLGVVITAVQLTSAAKNAITNAIVTHFASSSVGDAAGGGLLSGMAAYFKTSAAAASLGQIGIAIAAGLGLGELIGKQVNTGLASLAESLGDSELASYYREYDTPFKAIKGLVETIKEGHTSIGEQVAEQISNIKIMEQKISDLPPQVQKVWKSVAMGEKPLKSIGKTGRSSFGVLSEAIENASWKMTEKFSGFLKLIPGYVEQTGKDANDKTKNGVANVGASVANGKNQITSLVKQTKNSVVSDYNNMNNSASNSVKNMSQNTTSSVQGMAGSVVTSIQGMAGNSTNNFSVMTKNATSSANGMSLSVINALTGMKNSSGTTLNGMASDMAQKFAKMQVDSSNGGKNVTNAFVGALGGLRGGANNQWGGVESDTRKHTKNTSGIIQRENWNPIGANLVNGLRIGLTNKWNSTGPAGLVGGIVSLARGLTSALKRAFGIHSPSRLWNKEIGQFLPPGIGLGMESAMPKLLNDASGMATDLTSAFNTSLQFTDPLQDLADMSADIASSINTDVATSTSTVIDTGRMSTDIASGIVDGMSMSQADQNRLLREQNELLRQLLAKDTGISSNDIFESVKRSNRKAYNRTGTNPLLY